MCVFIHSPPLIPPPLCVFQFYPAVYPFQARTDLEGSREEGNVVKVIQQHDLDSNLDWWLVEVYGKQGYVPAAYLYKIQ